MKKLLSILLALVMALSLVACGGGGEPDVDPDDPGTLNGDTSGDGVTGSTDGFGDFASILVPEDFEFKRDSFNEDNPHFVSVKRSDFAYFDFHNFTEESELMSDYEYCKKTYTNEQTDVSANYGGIDWTGFQYSDGWGGYGFEVYVIMGSNYLKVSSAGFAFDHEIVQAVLGSVVMSDGSGASGSGSSGTGSSTGVSWLDYWVGDWFGWWYMTDATGTYAAHTDTVWDACARIEAYENMRGCLELWDTEGNSESLIAAIDLSFANPDDTEFGVMCCEGGQFFSMLLESGDWYVNPDEIAYENIFEFSGTYSDEYGTFYYRVVLRPWGTLWDDLGESYYPDCYEDWYLPLIKSGKSMPDYIG